MRCKTWFSAPKAYITSRNRDPEEAHSQYCFAVAFARFSLAPAAVLDGEVRHLEGQAGGLRPCLTSSQVG